MLLDAGLRIWSDYRELEVGDRLLQRINDGLSRSKFGIVVLSPSFFRKRWPQAELEGIFSLDMSGRSTLLPLWHNLTIEDVEQRSPVLAGRVALDTSLGIEEIGSRLFDRMTGARSARREARRSRMVAIQRSREAFASNATFSVRDVVKITGASRGRLASWHEKRWTGTVGEFRDAKFTVNNVVAVSALQHWDAVGIKLENKIAGSLYYAIRAAAVPFVLIHMTGGDSWVQAVEIDDVVKTLSGSPPAVVYDPEELLVSLHQRLIN
jgi:hypothetical protein